MNKKIIIIIAAILIIFPMLVSAYTLLQPLPGGDQILEKDVTLSQYLGWLFRFVLAATAFLAVMKIVIGGMHIMIGGASESSQTKGREMISMALWGVLLAITSVLILTAINPNLIKTGLTVPDIKVKSKNIAKEVIFPNMGGGCCVKTGWTGTQCEDVSSSDDCKKGSFYYLQSCSTFDGCKKEEKKCPEGFVWVKSISEKEGSCIDLRDKKPKEMMICYGKDKWKDKTIECDKERYNKCGYHYTGTPKCEYEAGL